MPTPPAAPTARALRTRAEKQLEKLEKYKPVGWYKVHSQIKDQYGFGYLKKLMAQHPKFVRGTQASSDLVGTGDYVANFASGGSFSGLSTLRIPKHSPWGAWPQTAAVLKKAPHKAMFGLYPGLTRPSHPPGRSHAAPATGSEAGRALPHGRTPRPHGGPGKAGGRSAGFGVAMAASHVRFFADRGFPARVVSPASRRCLRGVPGQA